MLVGVESRCGHLWCPHQKHRLSWSGWRRWGLAYRWKKHILGKVKANGCSNKWAEGYKVKGWRLNTFTETWTCFLKSAAFHTSSFWDSKRLFIHLQSNIWSLAWVTFDFLAKLVAAYPWKQRSFVYNKPKWTFTQRQSGFSKGKAWLKKNPKPLQMQWNKRLDEDLKPSEWPQGTK